ncbi:unnamed protein product [Toxocara canis]|uniref:Translin-associated protein X n=1 Tax=Toxocara canis TaxID=6265 RepID=A0A183UWX3_TOXCA|nr:unnamed protein product [Toxocara canis]
MESSNRGGKEKQQGMAYRSKRFKQNADEEFTGKTLDVEKASLINQHDKELFQSYQRELDGRNDRYERLVKLSRDITIESKRIIFQLHRYTAAKTEKEKEDLLKEVSTRLANLRQKQFYEIAKELHNLDQNLYNRAVAFGLQEFIEAWSFYTFIAANDFLRIDQIAEGLSFNMPTDKGDTTEKCFVEVSVMDYLLGLSDLGGELMRFAINKVAADHCAPTEVAEFMRRLYAYYLLLGNLSYNKDYADKLRVLHNSLMKVEYELYLLKVRSSEVPKEMIADYMSLCVSEVQQSSNMASESARTSYY